MNYTKERSKYGGVVGTLLIHSTPGLGFSNDPNSAIFKEKLPSGYLKCDGSVLSARDFPALAAVLGVGSNTRFLKDNSNVREADLETGDQGQFQLPDLGSKVIIGGRGTGLYSNFRIDRGTEETNPTTRTGPQIEIFSNFGDRIETFYIGNMLVSSDSSIDMIGNPRYRMDRATSETALQINNFQGHLHASNQYYTNFTTQHQVRQALPAGKDGGNRPASSGHGMESGDTATWEGDSSHKHNITRPTNYTHNFVYGYPQFDVDMSGVSAAVSVKVGNQEKLDELATPFILVEYIIKF
jgi:hypothetical protein